MRYQDLDLPRSLRDLSDAIGRERALFLVGQLRPCGGRRWRRSLYIPKRVKPNHPLVRLVGLADAERLAKKLGGLNLQPATGESVALDARDRFVREEIAKGRPRGEVAAEAGVSVRQLARIASSLGRGGRGSFRRRAACGWQRTADFTN